MSVKCVMCGKLVLSVIDKDSTQEDINWAALEKVGMSYCCTAHMQDHIKQQVLEGKIPVIATPMIISKLKF